MQIRAPMSKGNRQYPNKLKLWKNIMCPPNSSTFRVRTTAPAANTAKTTANTLELSEDAEYEMATPRKTMKKKGPQRSQSRRACPGSSRYGLGKTTCRRLMPTRRRSLLMVSQTGSVRVFAEGPPSKPVEPWEPKSGTGGEESMAGLRGGGAASGVGVLGGGNAEGTCAEEMDELTGMEARGGLDGFAGGTDPGYCIADGGCCCT